MIITLLIVACVLLSVAVVILFAVLKKQRDEISALKICVCSLGKNYEFLDDYTDSINDKVDRLDYFVDIVSKYGKVVIDKEDETT